MPVKFKTISELKHDAKNILREVQETGGQVIVTLNGKPLAAIVPATEGDFLFQKGGAQKKPEKKKKR